MKTDSYTRKPEWLKIQLKTPAQYHAVKESLAENSLTTVCEEARCPNMHECWGEHKTATFMILGDTCTRRCRFCAVKTGLPGEVDLTEPRRVATSVRELEVKHAVITMVNRDDLSDGGAEVLANTVRAIRQEAPDVTVEVLSSDLMGNEKAIQTLCESLPEIISHNIETVRRLTPLIRSRSEYERSLEFLRLCSNAAKNASSEEKTMLVKSSIMVGLGETFDELEKTLDDLKVVGVQIVNIGQYLQPGRTNTPVQKYWEPKEFWELKKAALYRGFLHCEAGPLVRSSYHAGIQYQDVLRRL